jgi:hypothetical protein
MADLILNTYGDQARKTDVVLNAIEILTAKETQIFNMLGKTTAIDTIHSYLTDTLRTAASAAVSESADYTIAASTTPTRLTNIVQKTTITYAVTDMQSDIEHFHGQNELARQTQKALMDWGNAAEFDLVRSTLVSGVSGTVMKMSGIIEATSKSTNHTSHTSGTVWSASILDGLMKGNWNNSNGDVATDLFLGSALRAQTDNFTQKSNVVVNGNGISTIVRTVSTYTTAFGTLNIHTHRYLSITGTDATGRVLGIRPEKLKVAMLRTPYVDMDLARNGGYTKRAIDGSFTLEVRNQDSNFWADGFLL